MSRPLTTTSLALACLALGSGAGAQPTVGSPDLEPGLQGRDDLWLFEDFEYADWPSHFSSVGQEQNVDRISSPAYQGANALRVRANTGEHYGTSISFGFDDLGIAEPEEVYFRYYVYIDSTWNLAASDGEIGKFPGFGGTYGVAGWGGTPSDGTNGWSARMMNWDDGDSHAVGFYTYHADMTGQYGTHMRWDPAFDRDRWYCIEAYVRLNTIDGASGNNDGVLRGWVDDVQAFDRTDLRFRDVDTLKVEEIWFNIYVGGSWTADHDMELYFDNLVASPNRIGCYQGSTGGGGAGAAGAGGSEAGGGGGAPALGGSGGSGAAGTGAVAATQSAPENDSDCGCRLPGSRGSRSGGPMGVLLAAGLVARRRRPQRGPDRGGSTGHEA